MTQPLTSFRAIAAACLLFTTAAFGAAPPADEDEAVSLLQTVYGQSVAPGPEADRHRELIATVLQRVKRSHASKVDLIALTAVATKAIEPLAPGGDPADVFKKGINEALRTLDAYSRYLDGRGQVNARGDSSGSFGGLGLELQGAEGAVRVVAPVPGGPAARAGIVSGDLILRVDDQPLQGLPLSDAVERMRGRPGTPVSLTVQRAGAEAFTLSVTRDTIRRQLLRWSMEGETLVLRLASFSGAASAEVAQAVAQASAAKQPRSVVLDLRGNPGGLLREAIKVADVFLSEGEIASLSGGSSGRQRVWQADADEMLTGVPMVVLVDTRSASASELVADALQHHGRATVMGQRSYGKGTVQTTFPLGENPGALRLTTSLYNGPSGQSVNRIGVAPDIELVASARSGDASATSGGGTIDASRGAAQPSAENTPARSAKARVAPSRCAPLKDTDPALACAVAFLAARDLDAFMAGLAD